MKKYPINTVHTIVLLRAIVCIIFLFSLCFPYLSEAQESEETPSLKQNTYLHIFNQSYWGVQLGGFLAQKTEVIPTLGLLKFDSRPSLGYYYGLHYVYNLNPKIGIETSIEHGVSSWYFSYRFKQSEVPQYPYADYLDYRTLPFGYWNYSFRPIFRTQLNTSWVGHLKAGLSLRNVNNGIMGFGASGMRDNQGNSARYYRISQIFDERPQLDFSFQLGVTHILSNYDLLHFDLVFHFARKPTSQGFYRIFPDEPDFADFYSEGDMDIRGNHIGLQVSYSFTRMSTELRKTKMEMRKNRRKK